MLEAVSEPSSLIEIKFYHKSCENSWKQKIFLGQTVAMSKPSLNPKTSEKYLELLQGSFHKNEINIIRIFWLTGL